MSQPVMDGDVSALREAISGTVHTPDQPGYEDARTIFNSMIEKRPAAIAQVESAADIAAALAFAREREIEVAVRGGGHSVAGACLTDGGLTIDLRKLNQVTVDPEARTATAQGGAHLGRLRPRLPAARAGDDRRPGLDHRRRRTDPRRRLRLAGAQVRDGCDNLLSAELVTAAGETVRASEDENPELFWALHGGGGNFGIATELTFRLHELPVATFAVLLWPPEDGAEVAAHVPRPDRRRRTGRAGRRLGLHHRPAGGVRAGGAAEPAGLRGGRLLRRHRGGGAGGAGAGDGARAPGRDDRRDALRGACSARSTTRPATATSGRPSTCRSSPTRPWTRMSRAPTGWSCRRRAQHIAFPLGGAFAQGAADSPLAFREAPWAIHPLGIWEDPADDERAITWARAICAMR